MNIQQFQYLLAVAEHRHFELAAQKCFISQSTLSTMISKFEEEIGIQIFDRKKKPVSITTEGMVVLEQLKTIVNEIEQLKELTKEIKGEQKGTLKISVIPTIAPFLLPLFLQDFAAKFPKLNITVREQTTAEIMHGIKSRDLDIGIVSIPIQDKEIIEFPLYDEPFIFYSDHKRNKGKISPKDIDLSNLYLMEEGHCMRTQVLKLCELNKKKLNTKLNFDFIAGSIDSLLRFVKSNKATTLLPHLSTLDFSANEKTMLREFSSPRPYRSVGLIIHRHFVKKKILTLLQQEITQKVKPFLPPKIERGKKLNPL